MTAPIWLLWEAVNCCSWHLMRMGIWLHVQEKETVSWLRWLRLFSVAAEDHSTFSLWSWGCFCLEREPPGKDSWRQKGFQSSSFRLNDGFALAVPACLTPGSEPVCLTDEQHRHELQLTHVLVWQTLTLYLQCDYLLLKPLMSNGYQARKMKSIKV